MENKDLHYYISHYGDFSPVNLGKIEKLEIINDDFVFISSEKSGDIEQVASDKQTKKEKFYF